MPENLKTGLDEGAESLGEALEAETRNAQVKEAFDDGRYEKRKPEARGGTMASAAALFVGMSFLLASCQKERPGDTSAATTSSAAVSASEAAPSASTPPSLPEPAGMVRVPVGSFVMGDDGDKSAKPAHKVTISKEFFIDKTEVSVADFAKCVAAKKCTPAFVHGPDMAEDEIEKFGKMCNAAHRDRQDHPVNCVDFGQAAAYCAFVGKRLPTEAEWEYAARGTDGRKYPWGNEDPGCDHAVTSGCGRAPTDAAGTKPVGSFPFAKSPFGALDMAGNVWEWVYDGFDPGMYAKGDVEDPAADPVGATGILRGGSWDFATSRLVSTTRQKFQRRVGHVSTGFRCVQGGVERKPPDAPQGKAAPASTKSKKDISRCLDECMKETEGVQPGQCQLACELNP